MNILSELQEVVLEECLFKKKQKTESQNRYCIILFSLTLVKVKTGSMGGLVDAVVCRAIPLVLQVTKGTLR